MVEASESEELDVTTTNESTHGLVDVEEPRSHPTKRAEVLRHVFPRPSRKNAPQDRIAPTRVIKSEYQRDRVASGSQSRPRVPFRRYITSFFGSSHNRTLPLSSPQSRSRASSFCSRRGSSLYGSAPSIDFVSPGAFIFSGPGLQSNTSFGNSTSRLSSLAETDSDFHILRSARTDSFSMIDNASVLDEGILEPIIEGGITRTMSDVLLAIRAPFEQLGAPLLYELREDTDSDCGHTPSTASGIVAPLRFRAVHRAPLEILQQVFDYLGPRDFNAARHTCRDWMRASLDSSVLLSMLGRGGWLSGIEAELSKEKAASCNAPNILKSRAWLLSRCLSRQCTLASAWTGNGLDVRPAIVQTSHIAFEELSNGFTASKVKDGSGLVVSASVCGSFLMVARDTLIYIYNLQSGSMVPATSVVCPRRVLSMSMDVSSGRHAVAALLEGRMGMVCELQYGCKTDDENLAEGHDDTRQMTSRDGSTTNNRAGENSSKLAHPTSTAGYCSFPYAQQWEDRIAGAPGMWGDPQGTVFDGMNDSRTYERVSTNEAWNLQLHGPLQDSIAHFRPIAEPCSRNLPIESGTSTFYRHLCSEDDPPRSVTICPQRRCVAFGCSAGIELHWIDAMTSQNLSRCFPLTAPSDYLHFLPPRPGLESAKKLRLISSAAHPNDRPSIRRKLFLGRASISSLWGSFGFESASRRLELPGCDHYHAIPLSDGHHVLFIDPPSGRLTLGCDAPLGGPSKLLRKVMFVPPEDKVVPRLYTAAADLSWGARVVAIYGDTIMLYSIPPDVIALSQLEQSAESAKMYASPPFAAAGLAKNHWLDWWDEPSASDTADKSPSDHSKSIWPINIRGTAIGKLPGICEVTIQTRPEIMLWAFTHASKCMAWRLHSYAEPVIRTEQHVCRDGIVHDNYAVDENDDVIMRDAPPASPVTRALGNVDESDEYVKAEKFGVLGFDGSASAVLQRKSQPPAVEDVDDDWVDLIDVRGCSNAWHEGNEDAIVFQSDARG